MPQCNPFEIALMLSAMHTPPKGGSVLLHLERACSPLRNLLEMEKSPRSWPSRCFYERGSWTLGNEMGSMYSDHHPLEFRGMPPEIRDQDPLRISPSPRPGWPLGPLAHHSGAITRPRGGCTRKNQGWISVTHPLTARCPYSTQKKTPWRASWWPTLTTSELFMANNSTPWECRESFLDKKHNTTFSETSEIEIDARLAAEDPSHPDSVELQRLMRESERSSEVATAILIILEMLLPKDGVFEKATLRVIAYRVITLLWLLRSERFNLAHSTLADISRQLECTRSLLSFYTRFWNKAIGLRCRMQKLEGTSEAYRQGAINGHATRRAKREGIDLAKTESVEMSQVSEDAGWGSRKYALEDEEDLVGDDSDGFSFDRTRREYEPESDLE